MNKKGFTLVELLAVIAILAILVIIAIPNVLKMFNDSKKNAFMVQAKETANASQQHIIMSSVKKFDCNEILTGQKYKECNAIVDENRQVWVDVIGSGTYENFMMADVTPGGESGYFIDLSKLNLIDISQEKTVKASLIENNKINEPIFKLMTADEMIDLESKYGGTLSDKQIQNIKDTYNNSLNNMKIENNTIKNTSTDYSVYSVKMILSPGKYNFTYKSNDVDNDNGPMINDNIINTHNNLKTNESKYFEDLNFIKYSVKTDENNMLIITGEIEISKATTYYIGGTVSGGGTFSDISIDGTATNSIEINGEENIYLLPEEVPSYKDAGISLDNKELTGNDVFEYTNLKSKEGEYRYNYIVKTNQGVKKYTRYITVLNYTSKKCFAFDTSSGTITRYYHTEEGKEGAKKCPTDVVIPAKISGVQVKNIGDYAFASLDGLAPISSYKNKYEVRLMDTSYIPNFKLTSLILPEGLVNIDKYAFIGNKLKTVTIPSTVTSIYGYAFYSNQLQSVIFKGDKSKISIGCGAFNGEKHSDEVNSLTAPKC